MAFAHGVCSAEREDTPEPASGPWGREETVAIDPEAPVPSDREKLERHSSETASPVPVEVGLASWYGPRFHRRRTASGERFDMFAMTAAHRTYAFGTLLCVRSLVTGRSVVVRVNDRGPRIRGRVVDLSRAAAVALGVHGLGLKPVEVAPVLQGQNTCEGA